ncbi:hypothetical protein ACO0KY_15220 [Undibacterium sp. Dicai25W]|uniref:hypothetical protein n=1 Tax=Undibacterium sp. Dicai25W TaxID=3413034 RepID=UPI003BF0F3DE
MQVISTKSELTKVSGGSDRFWNAASKGVNFATSWPVVGATGIFAGAVYLGSRINSWYQGRR